MENSTISCHSKKAAADNNNTHEAEESSWTFYIQEFMCENGEKSCFSSDYETPSLLSDAASSAVKRFINKNCNPTVALNNLKKKKPKEPEVDEDLVDTASSPVNSPKISYINQFMNEKEKVKMDVSNQVKRNNLGQSARIIERDIQK
ncbi:vascular-related protein 4 [Forsythia ovata]|uniref:Vascular-related protein 4 n=1 Tax=Forsythia ovata TaxID=205694 RepID=A0ABD1S7J6_9LAMI